LAYDQFVSVVPQGLVHDYCAINRINEYLCHHEMGFFSRINGLGLINEDSEWQSIEQTI